MRLQTSNQSIANFEKLALTFILWRFVSNDELIVKLFKPKNQRITKKWHKQKSKLK
jgi:hypothetical protein